MNGRTARVRNSEPAALALAGASALSARAGEQYALLVAVQDYPKAEFNPLRYTRDDMTEFRRVLLDSGFRDDHVVFMNDNQDRPELLPEIKKIRKPIHLLPRRTPISRRRRS